MEHWQNLSEIKLLILYIALFAFKREILQCGFFFYIKWGTCIHSRFTGKIQSKSDNLWKHKIVPWNSLNSSRILNKEVIIHTLQNLLFCDT